MGRDTDFEFGWNEADNLDPPWGASSSGKAGRTSAGTESHYAKRSKQRPAVEASAVPASFSEQVGYNGFVAVITNDLQVDAFLKCVMLQFNSFREEVRQMAQAPAPSASASGSRGGNQRPQNSTSTRTGIPFLKVEMMSRDAKKAKIMDYQIPEEPANGGRKFNDVILKLFYNGSLFLWGLKTSSPHYSNLYNWFGGDMDDWKDKEFMLGTEVREFDGRVFAHSEQIPVSGKRK